MRKKQKIRGHNSPSSRAKAEKRSDKLEKESEKAPDSLVERLKSGEHGAAEELVETYHQRLYLFFRRLGHDAQTSEDLTQETFSHSWRHIGHLRSAAALQSWLYRIAANVSKVYWRRSRRAATVDIDLFEVSDGAESELRNVEDLEDLRRLKDALAELSFKLRQAVVLHYMQHLTIAEAAEAASISQGTFKSRLSRALRALRKKLAEKPTLK